MCRLNGMNGKKLLKALAKIMHDQKLLAMEIVEFDPSRDHLRMTEKLITDFLEIIQER